jgi:hypothetical protein
MSYETAQNPSSLVRPLIVNSHGVVKQKKGIFRPPFPEIDLRNWQGFCFSPLRWVARKVGDLQDDDLEIVWLHEMCHWNLESSPFILLKQNEMFKFYDLIIKSFEDGQQIRVPLILNKPGNQLRAQWEILVSLNRGSELVEEVYAVQTSLLTARREGYISHSELKFKIEQYQEAYTEIIPAFAAGFEGINFFASFIGGGAVKALILSSLETADPNKALLDTMYELTKSDSGDFELFELLYNLVHDHKNDNAQDFLRNFTSRYPRAYAHGTWELKSEIQL